MTFDTIIQFRGTVAHKHKIEEYAARLGKEPSQIYREFIDSIDVDKNRILDTISFHKFELERLTNLVKMDEERQIKDSQRPVNPQPKTNHIEERIKKIVNEKLKALMSKYGVALKFNNEEEKTEKINEIKKEIEVSCDLNMESRAEVMNILTIKAMQFIINLPIDDINKIMERYNDVIQ